MCVCVYAHKFNSVYSNIPYIAKWHDIVRGVDLSTRQTRRKEIRKYGHGKSRYPHGKDKPNMVKTNLIW